MKVRELFTKEKIKHFLWEAGKYIFMFVVADTIMYVLVRDIRFSREVVRWLSYATYAVLDFLRIPIIRTPAVAPL